MLQSLIAEIKEYKKPSILASLYMVFEVMFEISIPFIMATLLDKGVQKGDMTTVLTYGLLMLVFAFLSVECSRLATGLLLQLALLRIYGRQSSRRSKPFPLKTSIVSPQVVW